MNNKRKKYSNKFKLTLGFTVLVFITMFVALFISFLIMLVLFRLNILKEVQSVQAFMVIFSVESIMIGVITSSLISRRTIKPLSQIIDAADKIADSDYSVRINLKDSDEFQSFAQSFNHMAREIGSVEILRTDFINDFSHEFKTPIISIKGFAEMLKNENLTDGERAEYLDIIISESDRLSNLSQNILELSRLEKQSIVTGKTNFNLCEEVRLAASQLENKWAEKNIEIIVTGDEAFTYANKEMMREVLINLLDNAVKFSPTDEQIEINISESSQNLTLSVSNKGSLTENQINHIFDKFYQGDPSHTASGNGLGLAIVKKIAELHSGSVKAYNKNDKVTFELSLPRSV